MVLIAKWDINCDPNPELQLWSDVRLQTLIYREPDSSLYIERDPNRQHHGVYHEMVK